MVLTPKKREGKSFLFEGLSRKKWTRNSPVRIENFSGNIQSSPSGVGRNVREELSTVRGKQGGTSTQE